MTHRVTPGAGQGSGQGEAGSEGTSIRPGLDSSGYRATPGALFVFGDYEVLEIIAHGGMGIVYKARQISLDRVVALKTILRERLNSERYIQRFLIEARAAAKLLHPNIVAVHEVGEVRGEQFYSMDYVAGQTLTQLIQDHPLSEFQAANYVLKITRAIHYAHTQGILHRDLKPGNIIIDWNDEPQVTDFGIAKILDRDAHQTVDGTVIGTPSYMSPEQAMGRNQTLDARSDLYSLGAILYELITGRPPFRAASSLATLQLVLETEPVPPRQMNPKISHDLETICLKCLQKRPSSRYRNAEELAEDLKRFSRHEPILARRIGVMERSWRWCKRKPALAATGAAATFLLLVVSIGSPIAAFQLNRSKLLAEDRALIARRNAYAADMRTVQTAIEESNFGYALQLLEWHRPRPGEEDIRNWEWRHFWRLCQSDDLATLSRHQADVYAAIASSTGRWVASWSADSVVTLWSMDENREVYSLTNGGAPPPSFSRSDRYLAIPLSTHEVRLIDLEGVTPLPPAFPHPKELRVVGFHPDDRHLLTYDGQAVRWWDLRTQTQVKELPAPSGAIQAFSADWALMAWSDNRNVTLWNAGSGEVWSKDTGHNSAGSARLRLTFSPDTASLAAAVASKAGGGWTLQIWDVATGEKSVSFPAHAGIITELAYSPNGKWLASSSYDQTTMVWDTRTWRQVNTLKGHSASVFSVSFLPDGERLVTSGRDRMVRLWRVRAEDSSEPHVELDREFCTELISERRGSFSPDGRMMVMIKGDGKTVMVDALSLEVVRRLDLPFSDIQRAAIGPKGSLISCGRDRGVITLWDPEKGALADLQLPNQDLARSMAFSLDAQWFAARGANGALAVWHLPDLKESETWRDLAKIQSPARILVFSPDSKRLALGHSDGAVSVWDLATRERLALFPGLGKGVLAMDFSRDGARLGVTSYDSPAIVWDLATQTELARFSGSHSSFFRIGFSPDGSRLFLSEWDNGRIMDVDTQREVARLKSYYPKFLDANTVLGLGEYELWFWHPPSLAEIDARMGQER